MTAWVVLAGLGLFGADPLSLDDALQIARQNSFAVRTAQVRVDKANDLVRAARGALGFNLSVNAAYSRFEGSVGGGSGSGSTSGSTTRENGSSSSAPTVNDSKTASVTLSQVFDLGRGLRSAVEAARFSLSAEQAGLDSASSDLDLAVRNAYLDVLLTRALVRVQRDALKAESARLEKARLRQRAGAIPPFDVLRLENEVKQTERALVEAEGAFETSKQALNNALARAIETPFEPVELAAVPAVPPDPTPLVAIAVQRRGEARQAEFQVRSLGKVADTNRRGLDPSLVVSATHNRVIDPFPGQKDNGTIGTIAVQWPIFDSGVTRALVQSALRDQTAAEIGREQLVLGIALEVRSAHTRLVTAQKSLAVAEDGLKLAREALRLAELRYDEGAGILIDVTQAQADVTAAEGGVENARSEYFKAYAALQRGVGSDSLESPAP